MEEADFKISRKEASFYLRQIRRNKNPLKRASVIDKASGLLGICQNQIFAEKWLNGYHHPVQISAEEHLVIMAELKRLDASHP